MRLGLIRRRARGARLVMDFDSSVGMVRALGSFLRGRDHRALSVGPGSRRLADALSRLPRSARRRAFVALAAMQGVPLNRAPSICIDDIDHWVSEQYGRGPYPAVMVGSGSGAALHLAAALRAPFLPQTTLVGVRQLAIHPDEPVHAMESIAPTARLVAMRNRRVAVHHMHDPAQDRPMLQGLAYLRLKRLALGPVYERFIEQRLAPGAEVIQLECTCDWRTSAVGERAYFQFGALGGVPEPEYYDSGPRIAAYLEAEGSPRRGWSPPAPDARRPEAEWGFDPALAGDIARAAERHGHRVRRLVVGEPQELSPFVADLHRWWYRRRGLPASRLLVESYVQWDPLWMLRLGAVPFWSRFNMEPSYEELQRYLDSADAYDEIHLNLFSQGVWSPGVVPIERWRDLVRSRARRHGALIGVDERSYPVDPGSTLRYTPAYASLPPRHSIPPPLSTADVDEFIVEQPLDRRVTWTDASPGRSLLPKPNHP